MGERMGQDRPGSFSASLSRGKASKAPKINQKHPVIKYNSALYKGSSGKELMQKLLPIFGLTRFIGGCGNGLKPRPSLSNQPSGQVAHQMMKVVVPYFAYPSSGVQCFPLTSLTGYGYEGIYWQTPRYASRRRIHNGCHPSPEKSPLNGNSHYHGSHLFPATSSPETS